MSPDDIYRRYQDLQSYIGWADDSARLVAETAGLLDPHIPALVEDFYAEIARHPAALKVITGGAAQVERLKGTLSAWLRELLSGQYGRDYVARRWRVGWRHVEIGLDQVYTNVALSRLRSGLVQALRKHWAQDEAKLLATLRALNQLLDLDLAIIEDAYQAEYTSRLQRTERLAAIGQVAGGVAHELRNPLNVVKTSVYYLLNARNPTAEKRAEHLNRIDRNVTLADGVITALSNFARMPVPDMRPFNLADCLRRVLEANPVPEECVVTIDCPSGLPSPLGDVEQLLIVFGNLVRNAREAMPNGGRLTITARLAENRVEVAVADTGVGIAPDRLAQVAEPLYSTKARGMGLGLAIARSVLEKNQGTLRVASEQGRGSTFTVVLQSSPPSPLTPRPLGGEGNKNGGVP
jgi:signal transduction histidine kinase